ncbi:DNA repair protein XRCC3-like [Oscarella lobularis]|uniref:DNA repair protein XRCC3-like n=1 Tax=Oscarella lobularis TaxID=121494 RepID=UPI0033131996
MTLPSVQTALQTWQAGVSRRRLSIGCPEMDARLGGGLLTDGITEISGESGAGKTQLSLQLCLTVQLPVEKGGLGGEALYVSTECSFPSKRLMQMATAFRETHQMIFSSVGQLTDRICIEHVASSDGLTALIDRLPQMTSQKNIKLIIIDSLAAVFRADFDQNEAVEKAKALLYIGRKLMEITRRKSIPVVCINQITALKPQRQGPTRSSSSPALGLAWSHVVTVRLFLTKSASTNEAEAEPTPRVMEIVFAPHLPQDRFEFQITKRGVFSTKTRSPTAYI